MLKYGSGRKNFSSPHFLSKKAGRQQDAAGLLAFLKKNCLVIPGTLTESPNFS